MLRTAAAVDVKDLLVRVKNGDDAELAAVAREVAMLVGDDRLGEDDDKDGLLVPALLARLAAAAPTAFVPRAASPVGLPSAARRARWPRRPALPAAPALAPPRPPPAAAARRRSPELRPPLPGVTGSRREWERER
ncbi:unnamed protein product [Urochloa humidicola]